MRKYTQEMFKKLLFLYELIKKKIDSQKKISK